MPRAANLQQANKPEIVKKIWTNSLLLFLFFAIVGHKCIDFWERYTIQQDVATMKQNINIMKDTVRHIERAYDTLQLDISSILKDVDKNPKMKPAQHKHRQEIYQCKEKACPYYDKDTQNQQSKATLVENKGTNPIFVEKLTETKNNYRQNKKTGPIGTDAITITRYPLKSSGINTASSDFNYIDMRDENVMTYL